MTAYSNRGFTLEFSLTIRLRWILGVFVPRKSEKLKTNRGFKAKWEDFVLKMAIFEAELSEEQARNNRGSIEVQFFDPHVPRGRPPRSSGLARVARLCGL